MAELDVGKEILMPESRRCYPKVFRVNFESTTSVTVLIQDQVGLLQLAAPVSIVCSIIEVMQNWNFVLHSKGHANYFRGTE